MPYVTYQRPDGRAVDFRIKGDAPTPTEQARIDAALSGQPPQPQQPTQEDIGFGTALGRSLGRGIDTAQASVFTGLEGLARAGAPIGQPETYRELADEQRRQREEIEIPEGGFGRKLTQAFGESAPMTGAGIGGALGGAYLGAGIGTLAGPAAPVAVPVGAAIGAVGGGFAASYPFLFNENIERQIEQHGDVKDWGKAAATAVPQAATEALTDVVTLRVGKVLGRPVSKALKGSIDKAVNKGTKDLIKTVGSAAAVGTVSGAIEESIQSALNRWQAEMPTGDDEALAEYLESAIIGGILQGGLGAAIGGVGARIQSKERKSWEDAVNDAQLEQDQLIGRAAQAEGIGAERESRLRAAYEEPIDLVPQDQIAGRLPDYSEQRTGVQTALEKEETRVPEGTPSLEPIETQPFTEQEYVKAVDTLRNEKLISPDKIKNKMRVGRPKANAIFQQLLQRNDASPAGAQGQYARITVPKGMSTRTGSDITGDITPGIKRDYVVRPIDKADEAPYSVYVNNSKKGKQSFQSETEAQAWAQQAGLQKFEVRRDRPTQYGVYELQYRSSKDGEEVVGKKVVDSFSTLKEANEGIKQYDPAYSPDSNRWRQRLTDEEIAQRVADDVKTELGKPTAALQKYLEDVVGPGRVEARVVPRVEGPEGAVAEGVTIDPRERTEKGLRQIVEVAGDLFRGDQNAINAVGTHEVVHVLRNADLLSKKEWDDLNQKALKEKVPGKTYTWAQRAVARGQGQDNPFLMEEAIAEMLRFYGQNPTALAKPTRGLIKRLWDFIKNLGGLVNRHGGDNVIRAILGGEVAGRPEGFGGLGPRPYPGNKLFSSVVVPPFYLKSDRFFQNIRQEKGQPQQWLGMLKNSGIKKEELDWLGLETWLRDQGNQPITRGEIMDYIRANALDVKEQENSWSPFPTPQQDQLLTLWSETAPDGMGFEEWITQKHYPPEMEPVVQAHLTELDRRRRQGSPQHEDATQTGGYNYTEILLHLPNLSPEFRVEAHHGGFPNIIAAARFKTRDYGDGKKTLFIEEIQSDLHQRGKRFGYIDKKTAEEINALEERQRILSQDWNSRNADEWHSIQRRLNDLEDFMDEDTRVPDAPFKTNWDELAFKRLVRWAAENDFDAIAWHGDPDSVALTEGYFSLEENNGEFTIAGGAADVTGIINFYTKRLRSFAQKYFKKFGATVQTIDPVRPEADEQTDFSKYISDENDLGSLISFAGRDGVLQAITGDRDYTLLNQLLKAAQITRNQRQFDINTAIDQAGIDRRDLLHVIQAAEGGVERIGMPEQDQYGNPRVSRHQMDINPEMKRTALEEGFPMFSAISKTRIQEVAETPQFQRWFKNSVVVDQEGLPEIMFHGTRADVDFHQFRALSHFGTKEAAMDRMAISGFFDAAKNGNSLANLAQHAGVYEEIVNGAADEIGISVENLGQYNINQALDEWWSSLQPNTRLNAVAQYNPQLLDRSRIFPVFLSIQKPLEIKDDGGLSDWRELITVAEMSGALTPAEAGTARKSGLDAALKMLERKGYDGFVYDNTVEDPGSTSYVPFRPQQAKSVFNRGSFDERDPRVNYSAVAVDKPLYSTTAPLGGRVPAQPSVDHLQDLTNKITYNNVAPVLQKLTPLMPGKWKFKTERGIENTFIALQDKMLSWGKLIDRMKKNGGFITNENDVYFREQLFSGQADAMIQEAHRDYYEPLVDAIHALPVTQTDAEEFRNLEGGGDMIMREIAEEYGTDHPKMALAEAALYALHAQERNREMAKRNDPGVRPEQHQSGSGMTDFEAQRILDWFASKSWGNLFIDENNPTSIRSLFRKIVKHTNDTRVWGGLNPDFRNRLKSDGSPADPYTDYAPLRGFISEHEQIDDEVHNFARTGRGFNIKGFEDPAALGRRRVAANLVANAVMQNQEAIVRSSKNKVGQSVLQLIRDNEEAVSDVMRIIESRPTKWGLDRKKGVVRRVPDMRFRDDPMILTVKENYEGDDGQLHNKETYVKFTDPKLARALNTKSSMGNTGIDAVVKGLLGVNRFLGSLATSYNPEFLISNFFRDFQTAGLNLSEYEMQGLKREVLKSIGPSLFAVYRSQRNGDRSNPWIQEFEEFRRRGGMTAFMGLHELEDTIRKINKSLNRDHSTTTEKVLKATLIKPMFEYIESLNLAVENGVRLAAYKALKSRFLQMTNDPTDPKNIKRAQEQAAFSAKNLTVNFNMGGYTKPWLNSLYLFYNASMQGSMALLNPLVRSKRMRKIWMGVLAAGVLQDLFMSMLSNEGEDGELLYDKIPDYILEHNLILPDLAGMTDKGYIKIPMPYLMNGIYNFGRSMMRGVRGGYTPGEAMSSSVGTLADSLNPFGSAHTWLNWVAPTVLDPLVDSQTNIKFTGGPIAPPENPFGPKEIASQRYWNNTNPAYVGIADWVSYLSGSDKRANLPGLAEWSPNQYEYWVEFLTGGAGTFISRTINASPFGEVNIIDRWINEEDFSVNDVPFLRRFIGNVSDREDMARYIKNRDHILSIRKGLRDAVNNNDREAYLGIIERYPSEYRIAARINRIERERQKISREIKKIREAKTLTEEQKEARIKLLKERQQELVNLGNRIMGDVQ